MLKFENNSVAKRLNTGACLNDSEDKIFQLYGKVATVLWKGKGEELAPFKEQYSGSFFSPEAIYTDFDPSGLIPPSR